MSEAGTLRRALVAILRRLEAGGPANVEEARRLAAEALAMPNESDGLSYRGG